MTILRAACVTLLGLILIGLSQTTIRKIHGLLSSRDPNVELPEDTTADVAIVLGYALFRDGTATEPLKGRVRAGVDAFLQGRARHLLFSGSHPFGNRTMRTEANVMRDLAAAMLEGQPVPADRWLAEEASTSTWENALFSLRMCRERGFRSVLVVTSPFHQLRSQWVFQRLAAAGSPPIEVYVARAAFWPHRGYRAPPLDRLMDYVDFYRELLALFYYYKLNRL